MFLQVSVCPYGGHVWLLWEACMVAPGGACVVALGGWGWGGGVLGVRGVCGCSWEGGWACVVRGCSGGHAWLLPEGGGVCGCSGWVGHVWLLWGACMVAPRGACVVTPGGHAWLLCGACMVAWGVVHGCCWGGACVVAPRGEASMGFYEIRRYNQ